MKPRVVIWTPLPAPYQVDRFNALADAGDVELEVWFNARHVSGRSWEIDESKWRFAYRYLAAHYWKTWWWGIPWPLLRNPKPDLVLILHSEPIYIVGWLIARLRGIIPCIVLEGPPDGWQRRTRFKEAIKHFMFRFTPFTLCAGPQTREHALYYGARGDRTPILEHCIDVAHYVAGADAARSGRDTLREKLGLRGVTFLCVGGLWPRKGVGYLLEAFASLQARASVECSLLLAGDGEEREALERKAKELGARNVVFAGYWQKPELPKLHACADVLVFPTLGDTNGYVVEEAMCGGLPVISTSAAGEIRTRLAEGITGYVVPPRDAEALADRMRIFLLEPQRARIMGEAARAAARGKSPQRWASQFAERARAMIDYRGGAAVSR